MTDNQIKETSDENLVIYLKDHSIVHPDEPLDHWTREEMENVAKNHREIPDLDGDYFFNNSER